VSFQNHDQKQGRLGKYELAQRAYAEGYCTGRNAARVFKTDSKKTCRKYTELTDMVYLAHTIDQPNLRISK
jgi:hypothetical protein